MTKQLEDNILPVGVFTKEENMLSVGVFSKEVKTFTQYYNEVFLPWVLRFGDAVDITLVIFFSIGFFSLLSTVAVALQITMLGFALLTMLLFSIKQLNDFCQSENKNIVHTANLILLLQLIIFSFASIAGTILPKYCSTAFLKGVVQAVPYLFFVINGFEILYHAVLIPIHLNKLHLAKQYKNKEEYLSSRRALLGNIFSIVRAVLFVGLILGGMLCASASYLPFVFGGLAILTITLRRICTESVFNWVLNKMDAPTFLRESKGSDAPTLVHHPYGQHDQKDIEGLNDKLFDAPLWGCSDRWELRVEQLLKDKKDKGEEDDGIKLVKKNLEEYISERRKQAPLEKKRVLSQLLANLTKWTWEKPELDHSILNQSFFRGKHSQTSSLVKLTEYLIETYPDKKPELSAQAP